MSRALRIQYPGADWRDRVAGITHKMSSGAVLASFAYVRNAGGEPNKITREDGTYAVLGYDAALRLTNEVYYSSGGVPQTTNSYGYDASGSRIKLVKGGLTLTNSVSGGYQITAVKNAANGSTLENYTYDSGGRVTQINRDSATLNLGYNTADQVTAVTNGASWVTYQHDASGRRTFSTNSASEMRKFLVAPTPGSDLESPLLVADASGAVQQGYVYLGDDPILRFDENGNAVYYLEDAMGSVAALVNASQTKIASINYDGFGNVRNQSGTTAAPTGTGGDFRFHGAWLEEQSGLYHMRAREYDARMGRFTSRDPNPGNFKTPDTLNPYSYANSNPSIFSDPSGRFTLIEVNIVSGKQAALAAFKGIATTQGRKKALKVLGNLVKDEALKRIKNFFPMPDMLSSFEQGEKVSKSLTSLICDNLDVPDWLFLEVPIFTDGTPHADGFNCKDGIDFKELGSFISQGIPRADFVLGHNEPTEGKTWVVGEIKSSAKTLYDQYGGTQEPPQFQAMMNYAAGHVHSRTALIICAIRGKGAPSNEIIQAQVVFKGMKKGALPLVVIVFE
ncbi:MAG: hypothetical protein M9920_13890 [Verrucomicrobiae bacterium]|nr:hypothetical protein [Verrucomicrobiae bacterium]